MATIPYPLIFNALPVRTGLASSIVTTAVDAGGTTRSLGTLTWTEETDAGGNANTGLYTTVAQIDQTWTFPLKVKYTITGQMGVAAVDIIRSGS